MGAGMQIVSTRLAEAAAALERDDAPAALDALVDAWGRTRSDRLARLVRVVSARVPTSPIGSGGSLAAQRAWLELAGKNRPRDLGALLPEVLSTNTTRASERLAALAARSDPRIADALLEQLEAPRHRGDRTAYFRAQVDLIAANADARAREVLGDLAPRFASVLHTSVGERVQKLLVRAHADSGPSPSFEHATLDRLESLLSRELRTEAHATEATARASRSEADLLADVYENPDDDAPRAVYADYLLERSDVRGEFIQLQLAHARDGLDEGVEARMFELEKAHGARWQGEMASAWAAVRFRRGFPHSTWAKLDRRTLASTENPAWRTIRTVIGGSKGNAWAPAETKALVKLLSASNLASVDGLSRAAVEALAQIPPLPLRSLELQWFASDALGALVDALARFPRLERLSFPVDGPFEAIVEHVFPALGGVGTLTLYDEIARAPAGTIAHLLDTRVHELQTWGASTLKLEREGGAFRATVDLRMGLWMGNPTAPVITRWLVDRRDEPISMLAIARPELLGEENLLRLREAYGARLK